MSEKGKKFWRRGITIDPAIIEGLVSAGDTEVWHKFFLAGPKKPVVLKARIANVGLPQADVLYDIWFAYQPKDDRRPKAVIAYWEVKLFPPRYGDHNGTLRLFVTARDPEIAIRLEGGKPSAALRFDGVEESCLLYVEPVGVTLEPVVVRQEQTEIRRVVAAIQLFAKTDAIMASYRYELPPANGDGDPLVVFDHRRNRLSGFAQVIEIIQEQKGGSFRFFQIRDLDLAGGETPKVTHIFTNQGLQAINESSDS